MCVCVHLSLVSWHPHELTPFRLVCLRAQECDVCGTRRTGRWREVVGRGGVREDWCDVCYQHKKKYVSPTHAHPFTSSPLYSFTPLLLYSCAPLLLCSFTLSLTHTVRGAGMAAVLLAGPLRRAAAACCRLGWSTPLVRAHAA